MRWTTRTLPAAAGWPSGGRTRPAPGAASAASRPPAPAWRAGRIRPWPGTAAACPPAGGATPPGARPAGAPAAPPLAAAAGGGGGPPEQIAGTGGTEGQRTRLEEKKVFVFIWEDAMSA